MAYTNGSVENFAVVDLVTLGGAIAATKFSEMGLKEGLNNVKRSIVMEDSEKVIVNFVNENNGKRHELEIPLNITAKALVTALNKAYNLQIDEANENECYMACEQPIAFLKGNRMLEDFGVRNGSTIIFGRK